MTSKRRSLKAIRSAAQPKNRSANQTEISKPDTLQPEEILHRGKIEKETAIGGAARKARSQMAGEERPDTYQAAAIWRISGAEAFREEMRFGRDRMGGHAGSDAGGMGE